MKKIYKFSFTIILIYSNCAFSISMDEAMESVKYCNGRPMPPGQRTCNYGSKSVDVYSNQRRQLSEYEQQLMRKALQPSDESSTYEESNEYSEQ
jgi:hypothetical protein